MKLKPFLPSLVWSLVFTFAAFSNAQSTCELEISDPIFASTLSGHIEEVSASGNLTGFHEDGSGRLDPPETVRVYRFSEEMSFFTNLGKAEDIAITDNGNVVAIAFHNETARDPDGGASFIRVFVSKDGSWQQRGADVPITTMRWKALALNHDGSLLAVRRKDTAIQVYRFDGNQWKTMGFPVLNARQDFSLSKYGNRMLLTSLNDGGGLVANGRVQVIEWNDPVWEGGDSVIGSASYDLFGRSVAANGDSSIVFIGAKGAADSGGVRSGVVEILVLQNGRLERSDKLEPSGGSDGDEFGYSVATNDNAAVVLVGAPSFSSEGLSNNGRVFIFQKTAGRYEQVTVVNGIRNNDRLGTSVAINELGTLLICGTNADSESDFAQYVLMGNLTGCGMTDLYPGAPTPGFPPPSLPIRPSPSASDDDSRTRTIPIVVGSVVGICFLLFCFGVANCCRRKCDKLESDVEMGDEIDDTDNGRSGASLSSEDRVPARFSFTMSDVEQTMNDSLDSGRSDNIDEVGQAMRNLMAYEEPLVKWQTALARRELLESYEPSDNEIQWLQLTRRLYHQLVPIWRQYYKLKFPERTEFCNVFVSHTGANKLTYAAPLYQYLVRNGCKTFLDKDSIQSGDVVDDEIIWSALTCTYLWCVVSKDFVQKWWPTRELMIGYVRFIQEGPPGFRLVMDCLEADKCQGLWRDHVINNMQSLKLYDRHGEVYQFPGGMIRHNPDESYPDRYEGLANRIILANLKSKY